MSKINYLMGEFVGYMTVAWLIALGLVVFCLPFVILFKLFS